MQKTFYEYISGYIYIFKKGYSSPTHTQCERTRCTTTVNLRKSRKIITKRMTVNSALQQISNGNDKLEGRNHSFILRQVNVNERTHRKQQSSWNT